MQFHEVRFPTALSFGSIGGPERRTDVVTLASGFEERNTPWAHSRRRYDAGIGLRSMDDIDALIAFFEARRGQMYGFRWKDWSDFKSCKPSEAVSAADQVIGIGDGVASVFPVVKAYASGEAAYARPVVKPVAGSVRVALDGVEQIEGDDFEVDTLTGRVTIFAEPLVGVVVTAGFEFDVPVRFDTDRIHTSAATFQAGDVPDVPVIEVRV
ncbi:TIGR02217 family protein [Marivita sp. S0852]|uniref:phage distal tail protein, Rcc01695 family n=1 Tax=Marivita sp. S0852 TaxID=3373893 RepID=UPI0039822640